MHSTPYEVLGIPPHAAPDVIRRAHQRITDDLRSRVASSPEAEELQRAADEALRILSNPTLRAFYDREFGDPNAASGRPDTQAPYVEPTVTPRAPGAQGAPAAANTRRSGSDVFRDWTTARPYFYAAIAGKDHNAVLSDEAVADAYRQRQSIRLMPLLGFPLGAAAGFFVFGGPSLESSVVAAFLGSFLGFALVYALAAIVFHFCMAAQITARRRSSAHYYLEKFQLMHAGFFGGFNITAAAAGFLGLGSCWLLMRRMNGLAVVFGILTIMHMALIAYLFDGIPLGTPAANQITKISFALFALWMLLLGFLGNRWYYKHATKAVRRVAHAQPLRAQSLLAMAGGERRGRAFALGALLVALPILGLALPEDAPDQGFTGAESGDQSLPTATAVPTMQVRSTSSPAAVAPEATSEQLISNLEYQYPQLDPQSNLYDAALLKKANALIAQFLQRGHPTNEAIIMAVQQLQASGQLHARR